MASLMSSCASALPAACKGFGAVCGQFWKYPAVTTWRCAPSEALTLSRAQVTRVLVPLLQTENKQSESGLAVTWFVLTATCKPPVLDLLNRIKIFPRFNRTRALRLRIPSEVSLPFLTTCSSSIVISESADSRARAPGTNCTSRDAPSDERTISP